MDRGLAFVLIVCLVIVFASSGKLLQMSDGKFLNRSPLTSIESYAAKINNPGILDAQFKNFIVNSSHNSYLATRQIFSNPSSQNVLKTIEGGARCIELDIHKRGKNEPVVMHSGQMVNFQHAKLSNVLYTIQQNAFRTTNDPFIIFFEVFNGDNEAMVNNLANAIKEYLGDRLYAGTLERWLAGANMNFLDVPIRTLLGKVIIVNNYHFENNDKPAIAEKTKANRARYLFPVIHGLTNAWGLDGRSTNDPRSLQRGVCTRVYPSNIAISSNYDPTPYFLLDYTFVSLNFGSSDSAELIANTRMFRHCNFVLKNTIIEQDGSILSPVGYVDNIPLYENAVDCLAAIRPNIAYRNYKWISDNAKFTLVMQLDGNLVCYEQKSGNPKWSSNTYGNSNAVLIMQRDGNLVIYSVRGSPLWSSNTMNAAFVDGYARISNDGIVEIVGDKTHKLK